jgi:hypothetical protein
MVKKLVVANGTVGPSVLEISGSVGSAHCSVHNNADHDVSETESRSILRWARGGKHLFCWVC